MATNKKIEVRYYSKTGNTKKLADAIAAAVGVKAKSVEEPFDGKADILFLGSSVYAAGVDEAVKKFVSSLDKTGVKNVVNFSTAAILPSTFGQIRKLLDAKGITLDTKEFHCRGEFKIMHKGRPNSEDIASAQKFAREIIK